MPICPQDGGETAKKGCPVESFEKDVENMKMRII
jgi:hypothetical protein